MKTPTEDRRDEGCAPTAGSASAVPARLPNGKQNPEYVKQRYWKLKAEGRVPRQSREAVNARQRQYRKTGKGKAIVEKWNKSDGHKKALARYRAKASSQPRKPAKTRAEKADAYAARIIRELEEMSEQNVKGETRSAAELSPPTCSPSF